MTPPGDSEEAEGREQGRVGERTGGRHSTRHSHAGTRGLSRAARTAAEKHFQVTRRDSAHMKVDSRKKLFFLPLPLPLSLPARSFSRCRAAFISPGVLSPSRPIYLLRPHPYTLPTLTHGERLIKRPGKSRRNLARQPRQDE